MDDCSSDNSVSVLNHYAKIDTRVRVVVNDQNSGSTFRQWQKGLTLIKGKYVWIAESDDYAELNFLSTLIPLLENNPTVSLAYCDSNIVDAENVSTGASSQWKNKRFQTSHWNKDYIISGTEELDQYLSADCTVNNASAVVLRRTSIEAAGGVDIGFRYAGDWHMYQKMCLVGDIAYCATRLNHFRDHSANASKSSFSNGADLFERQKCFAYLFQVKALSAKSQKTMLSLASREFRTLCYALLKRTWRPNLLFKYIKGIGAVSKQFAVYMQLSSVALVLRRKY